MTIDILLVDDEPGIVKMLAKVLRRVRPEWKCTTATSAEEALAALALAPYDAIVSDMRMPVMDGAELLRLVRNQAPTTARIVLTGHADEEAHQRALAVAHEFLGKPCSRDELVACIERVTSRSTDSSRLPRLVPR